MFEKIIDIDAECIKNKVFLTNTNTAVYGDLWPSFIEDLNDLKCGYWAEMMEDLFDSDFIVHEKERRRRLNIPIDIRDKGAAHIGKWLETTPDPYEILRKPATGTGGKTGRWRR